MASGNAEVTATESKVTAAEAKVETAKLEVAAAEAKVAAAKQEVAAAEAKVAAAKAKVAAAKQEVAAAEAKVAAAKQEYRAVPDDDPDKEMLRDDWKIARKGLDGAQKGLDGAQKGLDSAQDGVKIARKGLDGAQDLLLRLQRASDTGTRAFDCSLPAPPPGPHFSVLDVVFRVCRFFIQRYRVCPDVDVVAWELHRGTLSQRMLCPALPCCRAACMALRAVCETACPHDSPPLVCVGALVVVCAGPSWWRLGSLLRTSGFPGAAGS